MEKTEKYNDLATIRKTLERAKEDGLCIGETALRRWVKTGAVHSVQSGNRALIFYPSLKEFLCGVSRDANSVMMRCSRITWPAGANETQYLFFDDDGRCAARSKDGETVTQNFGFAAAVADPGAHLHPADDRDRALMLAGLQGYRDYLKRSVDNLPQKHKPSPELAETIKNHQKSITRLSAEIERLSGR